jgi:23S rRNA (guanosine2251-2'-O)-methyltransferase
MQERSLMNDLVYGRNAVREALRAQRRTLVRLFVAAGANEAGTLAAVTQQARDVGVAVERVDRRELERLVHGVNHQGVVLECGPYPYTDVDAMLTRAEQRAEPVLLLMLDHLQDPQNIGTLLRTAEVVGVHGVITPGRRAAEITPAVVNAASGATEHLLIAEVTNVVQTIQQLQRAGVWVAGVEDDPEARDYDAVDLDGPLALVLGAEGAGLARLTRERCDYLVRLPMRGEIASLNVAVAGSILLYHAWRVRAR